MASLLESLNIQVLQQKKLLREKFANCGKLTFENDMRNDFGQK